MSDLSFVNFMGDPVALDPAKHAKVKAKPDEVSKHNGWRVVGIPPDAEKEAREGRDRLAAMAERSGGKAIAPFDPDAWLRKFKKRAVRSKPYEVQSAAHDCLNLAKKAGWTFLEVNEIKKEVRGA